MIALAGTKADPVMVHFAAYCLAADLDFAVVDLIDIARGGSWRLSAPPDPDDFIAGSELIRPAELTGIYLRPISLGATSDEAARWTGLLDGFYAWLDEAEVIAVNSPSVAHSLNTYKPAHYAWLSAAGFTVPASLLTADREHLREFVAAGAAVVKPVSGVRARTRGITADDFPRLARTQGPVLVQRRIDGDDVRVHVVGQDVIACRFTSSAIDYRTDPEASRSRTEIPPPLADQLVAATAAQGLAFAGWDFKVDRDGRFWCLECNPMPGYSFYDRLCDGAVSAALVTLLHGPG